MFYRLLIYYTSHFPFPRRGLKYFLRFMHGLGMEYKIYKKKLPGNFEMWLMPKDHIQQQLFWYGYYDKPLGDLLKKIIEPGDVFLDIGANIGYFSLLAALVDPSVTVIAFEPASLIFKKLQQNIALNTFKNIQAVNAAAGEFNEEKNLFLSGIDNWGMSSFHQPENYSGKSESVKVVCIDDWFRQSRLRKIDIIKIDIEGHELFALRGMLTVLLKFYPLLIIEINQEVLDKFNVKPDAIIDFLNKLGYDGFVISEESGLLPLKTSPIDQTINAFFIPRVKLNIFNKILNK